MTSRAEMERRAERVLERIRAGDRTAYEIAAKLGLVREGFGRPAHLLARPLATLQRRGLIEAEPDPANRSQMLYQARDGETKTAVTPPALRRTRSG